MTGTSSMRNRLVYVACAGALASGPWSNTCAAAQSPFDSAAVYLPLDEGEVLARPEGAKTEQRGTPDFRAAKGATGLLIDSGGRSASMLAVTGNRLVDPTHVTVAFWMKPLVAYGKTRHYLLCIQSTANRDEAMYLFVENGSLFLQSRAGGKWQGTLFNFTWIGKPTWQPGTWYHVAATWGTRQPTTFYVDGKSVHRADMKLGFSGTSAPVDRIMVGCDSEGGSQANAVLDEMVIFSDVLAENKIKRLMTPPERARSSRRTPMTTKETNTGPSGRRLSGDEAPSRGAAASLAPWASKARPSDVPKRHVEQVVRSRHEYVVTHGGTMDGRSCRSPMGCGMAREGALEQTWESNRAVRLENVGDSDVVNPWLSNGRNLFRSIDEIVATAVTPDMSEREKASALWWQEINQRYHFSGNTDNNELCDVVKVLNVYGYNTCGNDSICLASLWRHAGMKAAPAHAVGHCISQVFYDGDWHFYDGDLHAVYLERDNATVASEQEFARDHDLIKRSHTQGILFPDSPASEETTAAMYIYERPASGGRGNHVKTTMDMTLRPGEALEWRWGHLTPPKSQGGGRALYPDTICNGLWEYRPDFAGTQWRRGADKVEGITSGPDGLAAEDGKSGSVVWSIRSPYVFVGGRLVCEGSGAKFSISTDGNSWTDVTGSLDSVLAKRGPGRYWYQLRCSLAGNARLKRLAIINDLQMAILSLPEMVLGANTFTYTDESRGDRTVRISHGWVERSSNKPPEAPPSPAYPADRGESDGTDIVFRWRAPNDPDGDRIADYRFELSERKDMRWPLSMSFAKLISRTSDKGKAQYSLPHAGMLAPDTTYYWHVRAKDSKGVWGPWSETWKFTARGPAYPVDVSMDYDQDRARGVLRWKPNRVGRRPALYRIYGSDEKGFSVSDTPYNVVVGKTKTLRNPFPANFVAETSKAELQVVGSGLDLPNANKAYYRVVAVDRNGKRSWSSDFVEAPRPFICSDPVKRAEVGRPYRYEVKCILSVGDLRARKSDKNTAFWDIETPAFEMTEGPAWLRIDPRSGVLSGTPDAAGTFSVELAATTDVQVRTVDANALAWGSEKVTSTRTKRIGRATQQFVIRVRR